jgi:cobalt-zinc-cadmium efflux system outer membrane protein
MHISIQSIITIAAMAGAAVVCTPPLEAGTISDRLERGEAGEQPGAELTLDEAISTALRLNPMLAAATEAVSAAESRLQQAGLYSNPELDLEAENFGGSGELTGIDFAETTFAISQPLLLGGKIAGRKGVAGSDHILATKDLEAVRLDVVAETTNAFNNVVTSQERVQLTEELFELAESFAATVHARVEAGKVSPVEEIRARAAAARTRVEVSKATRALAVARVRLAGTWGSSEPRFTRALGQLPTPTTPPPYGVLAPKLAETPEMDRLTEQVQRQEHVVELEGSRGVPDLTVTAGPRHYRDTGEWAWVGGFSMPLPIFDRNQGARRAAEFDLERTRREVEAQRIALEGRLAQILERLRAVSEEARTYREEIVPASTEAFDAMSIGFREGKFGFLEVLDAQRSLFEARLLHLDTMQRYATARAQLERLIGLSLGDQTDCESGNSALLRGERQ